MFGSVAHGACLAPKSVKLHLQNLGETPPPKKNIENSLEVSRSFAMNFPKNTQNYNLDPVVEKTLFIVGSFCAAVSTSPKSFAL